MSGQYIRSKRFGWPGNWGQQVVTPYEAQTLPAKSAKAEPQKAPKKA